MQIRATKNRVSVWPKKGELEHAAEDHHKSTSIKNNMHHHHHQLYTNMEQSMYAHVARRSNKNEETEPQTAFLLLPSLSSGPGKLTLCGYKCTLECLIDNNLTTTIITIPTFLVTMITMTMMQLQESEEEKKEEGEGAEKKDDSIVYADLDKSAMSEGSIHMIKSNQNYLLTLSFYILMNSILHWYM